MAQQNRNNTCNLYKTKRPAGKDCDEYPFATTIQGGSTDNRRTWQGSAVDLPNTQTLNPNDPAVMPNPGMSLSLISSRANRSGGGVLTWFFRKNRMMDGENF
ncbi:NucA/NucB deoxyribonuclease domain-containing protein [Rhodococcus marinonascens]|uniref:NucA/NucB deoxyribonuclease domain-containing protein n=1 Tax=Rhodococcus marinonascens TaxID=38311 RepID=UPI0009341454